MRSDHALGASILHIAPGAVDIALSASPSASQQHGFVHAGALAAIADSAAGYAALSLMPPGAGRRLAGVPGIGPMIASAIVATAPDPHAFTSARHFAAWLGLTPKQHATGGRQSVGRISKRGDSYLRRLLINGAQSVLRWAKKGKSSPWLIALLERRPRSVVAVALANKMARIVWAMLSRGEDYRRDAIVSAT